MNENDKIKLLQPLLKFQPEIFEKTTLIITSNGGESNNYGNGVQISYRGSNYFVTCWHVIKNAKFIAHSPEVLDTIFPHAGIDGRRFHSDPIIVDEDADLAIFRLSDASAKNIFDITESHDFKSDKFKDNISAAVYILGFPGMLTEGVELDRGSYRYDAISYGAFGGITKVEERWIQGDFAEREKLSPIINLDGNEMELTGGSRDIHGMSGCGAWCINQDEKLILIGLVSHKDPTNNDKNQHKINLVPIWKIVDLLKKIT